MVKKIAYHKNTLALFVFLATAILLLIYFTPFVLHLNDWNFGSGEDQLKNVFTFKEFIKHGQGFQLNNVNYPFGEHVLYCDAQPLIAFVCKLLHLEHYSTFMLHFLMLLSICISSVLLLFILLHFNLPAVYSCTCSILMALLAPQLHRILGHYGLAYSFYIPLLIYLFVVVKKPVIQKSFYAFVLITAFSFVHPYYIAIGLLFSIVYLGLSYTFHQINFRKFLLSALLISMSVVCFKTIILLTDSIKDRPDLPYGHWAYRSTFAGVFIPHIHPFDIMIRNLGYKTYCDSEAMAYVGLLGIPFALFLLSRLLYKAYKQKRFSKRFLSIHLGLNLLLLTCFISWLIACYYPFRLGLDFLVDYTGPYKQFRGLGRLGWIFYYGLCISLSYYIYVLFRSIRRQKKTLAYAFLSSCLLIWTIEVNGNLNYIQSFFKYHNQDLFAHENLLSKSCQKIDLSKYDAVLSLPFFQVGNEHIAYSGNAFSQQQAYYMAYNYNKAFISIEGSRSSFSQSMLAIQLLSAAYIPKQIKAFIPATKHILILSDARVEDSTLWILRSSKIIQRSNLLNIYDFDCAHLHEPIPAPTEYVDYDSLLNQKPNFPLHYGEFGTARANFLQSSKVFKDYLDLYQSALHMNADVEMELSTWTALDSSSTSFGDLIVEIEEKKGTMRQYHLNQAPMEYNVYKGAQRRSMKFPIQTNDKAIHVYAVGKDRIFNFLLKPAAMNLRLRLAQSGYSLFNNFEIADKAR